jgi:hypothetical protein
MAQAVIDIRLDQLISRHPDLLRWVEGRIGAARTLANLIIDLPPEQIVALTCYIAGRTGVSFDTVAQAVITDIEQSPPGGIDEASRVARAVNRHPRTFPQPSGPTTTPAAYPRTLADDHLPRHTR